MKMNKRVLIAIVVVLAVVLMAQTGAWAGKLQAGSEAPVAAPENAGVRPHGTTGFHPSGPNSAVYVAPSGPTEKTFNIVDYTDDLPTAPAADAPEGAAFLKGTESGTGTTLSKSYTIEVELGADGGTVFYWSGSGWVELTVTDNEVTIPAGAPNPVYLALLSN